MLYHVYFEVIGVLAIVSEEIFITTFEKTALRSLPWQTGVISQQKLTTTIG